MSMMISNDAVKEIISIAGQRGVISNEDVDKINKEIVVYKKPFVDLLSSTSLNDEKQLAEFISSAYGVPFIEIDPDEINDEALNKLTNEYLIKNHIFPFAIKGSFLSIAICDQTKLYQAKGLKIMTGMDVEMFLVTPTNLQKLYDKAGIEVKEEATISTEIFSLGALKKKDEDDLIEEEPLTERDQTEAEEFVTGILMDAYKTGVSDIHIESFRNKRQIRFRVDGVLAEQKKYSGEIKQRYLACVSILKLLSGARIEEKRMPQDGAIAFNHENIEFDLRVSFLPVQGGQERVVMRLLRKDSIKLDLQALGFKDEAFSKIQESIYATQGLILVTGPTGSGKTTTLYSILNDLNDVKRNILTAEDPIEYELEGISQSQMKADINYTFARALRTFLRQDPEVILVGEIRDEETGNIAVEAALTGHLVLSTLHTNDAVNTVIRLTNMGIPNYLVSSSVTLVIGQRLARSNCQECLIDDKKSSATILKTMKLPADLKPKIGKGCKKCGDSGYKGRQGIYEVLKITPTIQDAILKNKTSPEIAKIAEDEGFQSMQAVGAEMIREGKLSLDEYQRTLFTA